MPQPSINDVHLDVALTNFSLAYFQRPDNYIATRVFPVVPVDKQSNKFWVWNKNDWMRSQVEIRPPGTESAGSGFSLSNTSYYANVFALHKDLDHQTAANADMNLERATTMWLTQQALLKMERDFVANFMTTGLWSVDYTGVATAPSANQFIQWSDKTNSNPRNDIEVAKLQILGTTGFEPNTLVLGYQVYQALKQHPDFKSQIQYTSPDSLTAELLGKILDIDRVFVSKGVYATNLEGETPAYSMIQGKGAWLGYVDPAATTESATAGVTFVWTGLPGASGNQIAVGSFWLPALKVQRYEIELAYSDQVIGADLGTYFGAAVL